MRRYTIITIIRIVGGVNHTYTAQRSGNNDYTGNYICPTLNNDTKIVTDFICMPNSKINSVKDESRIGNLVFSVNERTREGIITSFVPKNGRMEVLIGAARTVTTPISSLNKLVANAPIQTATAVRPTVVPVQATTPLTTTAAVARSRSQVGNDEFTALQTIIDATRDIRLEKTFKRDIPTNLQQFLVNFFTEYNAAKNTIYVNDKVVQTTTGRRRSLGDIYKLCKYYFPTCTLREVIVLLYTTLPTVLTNGFRSSYCTTIRKRVWYYSRGDNNTITNTDTIDEYGHMANWYTSKI